jgi:D-alanine transfer protein
MLQFPSTLAKSPPLEFAVRRLASGGRLDEIVFYMLWPLGKIQNAILDLQDHFAALGYILHNTKRATRHHLEVINWSELIADQGKNRGKSAGLEKHIVPPWAKEWIFRKRLEVTPEWEDLELLLRVLARIHARPLLLCTPLDGQVYDEAGISQSARDAFYTKVRGLAQRYNFPLIQFKEREADPAFLEPQSTHLTGKGWMFYNRVLDDFYHDRVPQSDGEYFAKRRNL